MNNKAQSLGMALLIAGMIFFAGVYFMNPIKTLVAGERATMECSLPASISDGTKLTCLALDGAVPYIIWLFISLGLGGVIDKYLG